MAQLREALHLWRDHIPGASILAEPVDPARDHLRGDPAAAVVLAEYGGYGSAENSGEDRELREQLGAWIDEGKVCHVFRHFPAVDSHPLAWCAAQAAEAAGRQGRFWEMHAALSALGARVDSREIDQAAQHLGLDGKRLRSDMEDASTAERILQDFSSGIRSGVNGAPTYYVCGVRQDVEGPAELCAQLERVLDGDMERFGVSTPRPVPNRVAIVRSWYDGLVRGDAHIVMESWGDEDGWRGWNHGSPDGGETSGSHAVQQLLRRSLDDRFLAYEYIERGNRVIVIGEAYGQRGREGTRLPCVHIWEIDEGRPKSIETFIPTLAITRTPRG